jgi:hypothetical protein
MKKDVLKKNLPDLNLNVAFGNSQGKIIWQPRIGCWYTDKIFDGSGLPAPYTGMSIFEVYYALGVSARLYEFNSCFRRLEHPKVKIEKARLNETDTETIINTPVGKQRVIHRQSANSAHPITLKWEVDSLEELKVATWREENATWEWDQEQYDYWLRTTEGLGAPTIYMPRMNIQCLYLEKMGVEKSVYALYDWPEAVEAFFNALEACHDRMIELINHSPIKLINFGENVHSGTLSPDLFFKYHLPACQSRCEKLHAAGKFVYSHWDGDTGPLLSYAKETGLDGIEAITPQPQGDVSLEQIKEGLADELFLIDGIPAIYFDDIYSEDNLVECVENIIELFAPKLILGISDEISSTGDIERIRIVDDIVNTYNDSR